MKRGALPLLALALLGLAGCGSVDKARFEAQAAVLEAKAGDVAAFLARNGPVLARLDAMAQDTGDAEIARQAASLRAAVEAARAALPEVRAAIAATRDGLAKLEADAAGRVPWYAAAAGIVLPLLPRLLAAVVPLAPFAKLAEIAAEACWALLATRRQKASDLPQPKA